MLAPARCYHRAVDDLFRAGQAAWPDLVGSYEQFCEMRSEQAIAACAADLFLAAACAAGEEAAATTFENRFRPAALAILAGLRIDEDVRREAVQLAFTRLLVGDGESGRKIRGYRGSAPLLAYVRVVVVRAAQELLRWRKTRREISEEAAPPLEAPDDPELAYLKRTYHRELAAAFADAVARLDPRAKTLLHHVLVNGMSIDRLAAIYGVHRATAARRVAKARAQVVKETRAAMRSRLHITAETLESILRLVESSADASVERLLAEDESPPP